MENTDSQDIKPIIDAFSYLVSNLYVQSEYICIIIAKCDSDFDEKLQIIETAQRDTQEMITKIIGIEKDLLVGNSSLHEEVINAINKTIPDATRSGEESSTASISDFMMVRAIDIINVLMIANSRGKGMERISYDVWELVRSQKIVLTHAMIRCYFDFCSTPLVEYHGSDFSILLKDFGKQDGYLITEKSLDLKPQVSFSSRKDVDIGLLNHSNTCWFNSTLQIFLKFPEIISKAALFLKSENEIIRYISYDKEVQQTPSNSRATRTTSAKFGTLAIIPPASFPFGVLSEQGGGGHDERVKQVKIWLCQILVLASQAPQSVKAMDLSSFICEYEYFILHDLLREYGDSFEPGSDPGPHRNLCAEFTRLVNAFPDIFECAFSIKKLQKFTDPFLTTCPSCNKEKDVSGTSEYSVLLNTNPTATEKNKLPNLGEIVKSIFMQKDTTTTRCDSENSGDKIICHQGFSFKYFFEPQSSHIAMELQTGCENEDSAAETDSKSTMPSISLTLREVINIADDTDDSNRHTNFSLSLCGYVAHDKGHYTFSWLKEKEDKIVRYDDETVNVQNFSSRVVDHPISFAIYKIKPSSISTSGANIRPKVSQCEWPGCNLTNEPLQNCNVNPEWCAKIDCVHAHCQANALATLMGITTTNVTLPVGCATCVLNTCFGESGKKIKKQLLEKKSNGEQNLKCACKGCDEVGGETICPTLGNAGKCHSEKCQRVLAKSCILQERKNCAYCLFKDKLSDDPNGTRYLGHTTKERIERDGGIALDIVRRAIAAQGRQPIPSLPNISDEGLIDISGITSDDEEVNEGDEVIADRYGIILCPEDINPLCIADQMNDFIRGDVIEVWNEMNNNLVDQINADKSRKNEPLLSVKFHSIHFITTLCFQNMNNESSINFDSDEWDGKFNLFQATRIMAGQCYDEDFFATKLHVFPVNVLKTHYYKMTSRMDTCEIIIEDTMSKKSSVTLTERTASSSTKKAKLSDVTISIPVLRSHQIRVVSGFLTWLDYVSRLHSGMTLKERTGKGPDEWSVCIAQTSDQSTTNDCAIGTCMNSTEEIYKCASENTFLDSRAMLPFALHWYFNARLYVFGSIVLRGIHIPKTPKGEEVFPVNKDKRGHWFFSDAKCCICEQSDSEVQVFVVIITIIIKIIII